MDKAGVITSNPSPMKAKVVAEKYADATLRLIERHGTEFSPLTLEKEKSLVRKLHLNVMSLLLAITLVLFIDKTTLGYSVLLGLFEETHLTKTEYNNINTFFYVGYLAAQWPGNYAMQRLPFGKFVAGLIFVWGMTVFLHAATTGYAGLAVLRLLLGASESVIIPAIEITIGMFYNRHEQSFLQPVLWISAATAPVFTSFISYGLLYSHDDIRPWKLLMIITGGLSTLLSILVWFRYPNNPSEATFLTLEEKVHVIQRVQKSSQSSIEQKQFKKAQFLETLHDPVSWLFCLQAFTIMLANNLYYGQQSLILQSLDITNLGGTLVDAASGGFGIVVCVAGALGLWLWPSNIAAHGLVWCLPSIAGGIGMVTIAWEQKLALLACLILAGNFTNTYIIALGWTTSTAAGYTKKMTRNVMFMLGYSVANIISPQIWVERDGPRYYGAWIAQIVVSWVGTPAILFLIRAILMKRNAERREWAAGLSGEERQRFEVGIVEEFDDGRLARREVDLAMIDLTDLENPFFIYPV